MALARYPTVRNFSSTRPAFARTSARNSIFAHFVGALHRSRRIQAEHIINQSSHLLQDPAAATSRNLTEKK
jgi:hypothetical protein